MMFAKTSLLPGRTWKSVFIPALRQRPIPRPAPDNDFPLVENVDKGPTFSVKATNPALKLPQQSRQTWGKRYALYLLVGLFISLAVALLLIWHFNTKNHGFPVLVDNHYTWTYGPTAILVLVVSVWRQVDHHYKLLAPWTTLERGAALAKHSLLLDYISPIQLTSFWNSLRNGHLSVTFTILGFVILKIITLVSTGLLVEESVVLPGKPAELQLATRFNGHLYNETEYVTKSDASLVYTAYGVLAGGLENQPGLTDALVYQNFRTPAIEPQTEAYITAEVDAFIPEFNCEPATVSINPLPYGANGSRNGDTIIIVNPSCVMMGGEQPTFVLDVSAEICPAHQLRGVIQRVNCSMDDAKSQFPNRQLLTLVEVEYNQTVTNSTGVAPDITSFALGIKRVKSLLCRPGYRTGRISLTHHVSKNGVNVTVDRLAFNDARIPGFLDEDLASMFTASLSDAANMFGDLSDSRDAEEFPSTLFKVMAAHFGSQYTVLFDGENNMRSAADLAFQQISVQIIGKNIVDTDQNVVDGSIILTQRRVIVNYASLWILVGGFIGMAMITLLLFKVRKKQLTYFNLATIHGFAQITALSPQLQKILRDIAVTSQRNVSAQLARYHFFSTTTGQRNSAEMISISAAFQTSELQDQSNGDSTRSAQTWWNPHITRRLPMGIILFLPLVVIAVLEILQVHSDSERGLLTLTSSNSHLSNAYSRFIPALVMFSVATLFNTIEFNISVLAPFNAMYGAGAPSYRSVQSSLIDKSPPVAMLAAARSRHFAALSSSAAAIIGSVLTIVVSGLFTIEQSSRIEKILVTRLETFDLAWPDSATNDGSAAVFTSLTESLNLSYPQNTYDELTFPDLSIGEITSESLVVDTAELRLTVPAMRANLDCSSLESSDFNVSASYNPRISSASATVEARFPLPPRCLFGGPAGNLDFIELNFRVGLTGNASYVGKLLDLHVGPYDAILGSPFGEADPRSQKDNPPGCPTLAFIYGFVDVDNPRRTSITTSMCYQQMQQIEANLTLELSRMEVSVSQPPVPDEKSIKLLPSSTDGDIAFPYRIQRHMDQSLSLFNQTRYASANLAESPVDGFFQGVLFGHEPLPESVLVGRENHLTIMTGINAFYRRYMAQAISRNMRVQRNDGPLAPLLDTETAIQGQSTHFSGVQRLVQHRGSKLILQIMLAIMTLLGVIAWKLTRLTDLVPYNPCTIFGVAHLLAGSRWCNDECEDLLMEAQHNEQEPHLEPSYRLGWWDMDNKPVDIKSGGDATGSDPLPHENLRYGIDIVKDVA